MSITIVGKPGIGKRYKIPVGCSLYRVIGTQQNTSSFLLLRDDTFSKSASRDIFRIADSFAYTPNNTMVLVERMSATLQTYNWSTSPSNPAARVRVQGDSGAWAQPFQDISTPTADKGSCSPEDPDIASYPSTLFTLDGNQGAAPELFVWYYFSDDPTIYTDCPGITDFDFSALVLLPTDAITEIVDNPNGITTSLIDQN